MKEKAKNRAFGRIMQMIASEKPALKKTFCVKEIGIFGSYVRGEQKKGSDIDVLVEFERPVGMFHFLELEEHLSRLLGAKVDLVSRRALKHYIGKRILSEVVSA